MCPVLSQRHDDDNLWNKYEPRPVLIMTSEINYDVRINADMSELID